jgi:hypothetical protein
MASGMGSKISAVLEAKNQSSKTLSAVDAAKECSSFVMTAWMTVCVELAGAETKTSMPNSVEYLITVSRANPD